MKQHIKTVLKHKWFVLLACLKVGGVPWWRILAHDWTKLGLCEAVGYSNFHTDKASYLQAWNHHQKNNKHHWEYWVVLHRGAVVPLEMPITFVREMFADWLAASRSYGGVWPASAETWDWWVKNKDVLLLHGTTRQKLEEIMSTYFNEDT